ncbi:MAG: hypothetical protein ABFC28_00475 [Rikenellaceae bacterium]
MKARNILYATFAIQAIFTLSSFIVGKPADLHKFIQRSPEARANLISTMMKNKLSMDEIQFEMAYKINLKYAKLVQPYLENENSIQQNKEKLIEINTNRFDELKAILTPEQLTQVALIRRQWIKRLEIILTRLKENNFTNQ